MSDPFSNTDKNVFLIKTDKMIDRGALMSRYSRTANPDIRDLYAKEFLGKDKFGSDFYRRIFIEYGDESISELVTAQMGIQGVSNVCAQIMEDSRIGLSFLEKSSRYVSYARKVSGRFQFMDADSCGFSGELASEYENVCGNLFETYSTMVQNLTMYIEERFPLDEVVSRISGADRELEDKAIEKAYRRAVSARVLDDARFLLPASTSTNLGITGNARAFLNVILRLKAYGLPEAQKMAVSMESELESEFPELIKAASDSHARRSIEYRVSRNRLIESNLSRNQKSGVEMISHMQEEQFAGIIKEMFSEKGGDNSPEMTLSKICAEISDMRRNRRDRPGRIFEIPEMSFRVGMSFGTFRDFHRHRMFTIIRGYLTGGGEKFMPDLVSVIPEEKRRYSQAMRASDELWKKLNSRYGPASAQYAVPFGQIYQFYVKGNLQEFAYFIELRTTPAAHYEIRRVAQEIYRRIRMAYPLSSAIIKFADTDEYDLGRIFQEMRIERKREGMK
ncbi:MAG: FAD-dependent thymidylate synthase [Candidatus Thermoplasmatota archaeon]|nr:FAD-dependent thymidylate synthase [Candidatus Thermoplasmatota archaeon]